MFGIPDQPHITYNFLTAIALWLAGGLGILTWMRSHPRTPASAYWLFSGVGLVYLGFDEHASLHEWMGDWLEGRGLQIPGFHDVDGIVLLAFALVGLLVSLAYRRELRAHPTVLTILTAGAATTLVAFGLDDFGSNRGLSGAAEERLESIAAMLFLGAFLVRFIQTFRVRPSQSPGADGRDATPAP